MGVSMDEVIRFAESQLERVNHWLEFAEAKNAALLVFNMALIAAVLKNSQSVYVFHYLLLIIICIGCVLIIISFSPCLDKVDQLFFSRLTVRYTNLIFYDDINKMTAEMYSQRILMEYFPSVNINQSGKIRYMHLIDEIVVNSSIAVRKYRIFKMVVALDVMILLLIICRLTYLCCIAIRS